MAAKLTPAGVVGLLDQPSGRFDELVERYELEKIKTIGDCYMAAAGIPSRGPTTRRRGPGGAGHARGVRADGRW